MSYSSEASVLWSEGASSGRRSVHRP